MKLRSRKKRVNTPQSRETNGSLKFIICIFLVISTLAVYWQVQDHEFINYDDEELTASSFSVSLKEDTKYVHPVPIYNNINYISH